MNFRIAKEIKLSLTASLALVVSALPFNSAAQSSIDEDQITFVKLTAEPVSYTHLTLPTKA